VDDMANKYLSLILLLLLLLPTASAKEDDSTSVKMTTCRLECPKEYKCPYRPNEKPFDIKSVIRSIKDQFTE